MKFSKCRTCRSMKAKGDPCAGCGAGLKSQTLQLRGRKPIAITKEHGFHAVRLISSAVAMGRAV